MEGHIGEDHGVVGPSRCLVKGLQNRAFRLCLGKGSEPFRRLLEPGEVELTDPAP